MNTPRKKTWLVNCTADEDRTKQSFKDECDMNRIVSRINKTGFVPLEASDSLRRQIYADASLAPASLEDAYAVVARADAAFSSLPARLRERFGGPSGLLAFIEDPKNIEEAISLGLVGKAQPTPISSPNSGASDSPGNEAAPPGGAKSAQEPAK